MVFKAISLFFPFFFFIEALSQRTECKVTKKGASFLVSKQQRIWGQMHSWMQQHAARGKRLSVNYGTPKLHCAQVSVLYSRLHYSLQLKVTYQCCLISNSMQRKKKLLWQLHHYNVDCHMSISLSTNRDLVSCQYRCTEANVMHHRLEVLVAECRVKNFLWWKMGISE